MSLSPGTRLGPYEVLAPIGAGGMGEVYQARDTRLDRIVAVKVLPELLALDPDFLARFEREAKAISHLQHPNICTLHDVGRDGAVEYLVLEYLVGETLAARINRTGALDAALSLDLAIQIAGALEAAHRAGIVHRDLKPGNVMLVRGASGSSLIAKLLDFGLAKPAALAGTSELTSAPTRTTPLTTQGAILGTFQYMAPEQIEGEEADTRSDIWAFGCLLHECFTGRPAFSGKTQASLIGAILKDDPPPLPTTAPEALKRVVSTCLSKNPDDRWQSAADLGRELRWLRDAPASSSRHVSSTRASSRVPGFGWLAATAATAALTGLIVWWAVRPAPVASETLRATLPIQVDTQADDPSFVISPNGRWLAYVSTDRRSLMLMELRSGDTRAIAQGDQVSEPFFSPDSLQVGFVGGLSDSSHGGARGALERVAVGGGAPVRITDGLAGLKGAAWGDDGWIYYSPAPAAGLWRVPAAGGTAEQLTEPDAAKGEKTHRRPFVLPGSQALLFVVGTSTITSFDDGHIEALTIGDRARHFVIDGATAPSYVPELGQLVYYHAGTLVAVPFDPDGLEVRGTPTTVLDGVSGEAGNGISRYSFSTGGTLVWLPMPEAATATLLAMDRQGRASKLADVPATIDHATPSPDGTRLALDPDGATQQLEILDLQRGNRQRLTFEWDNAEPLWTADGTRLIYRSNVGGGSRNIYWRPADGSGMGERLTTSDYDQVPDTVFGRSLVYEVIDPQTQIDLWTMSLDDRTPVPLIQTPFDETAARFSPDGRWLVYQSNPSGAPEIYVQPFPSASRRIQVSAGGGQEPQWMPSGREIVYRRGLDVMVAAFTPSLAFTAAAPTRLFSLEPTDKLLNIGRDGKILVRRTTAAPPANPHIIIGWFDDVRRISRAR